MTLASHLEKSPSEVALFAVTDLNKAVPGGLPFQPQSLEILKQREQSGLDPHVRCLPSNFPRMFTLPHITKFVQTRQAAAVDQRIQRQLQADLWRNGRPLPMPFIPQPRVEWVFDSASRKGDTLQETNEVVATDLWMDCHWAPLRLQRGDGDGTVSATELRDPGNRRDR